MKRAIRTVASREQDPSEMSTGYALADPKKALLDRICADPDDLSLRRSYAALLSEDDPRREFIEAQLLMASREVNPEDPKYIEAFSSSSYLIQSHYEKWRPDWEGETNSCVEEYEFWRGFVELAQVSGRGFKHFGDRLRSAAPILHLDLVATGGMWRELSKSSALRSIRSISLVDNQLTDDDVSAIARSPYLSDLRWLALTNNPGISQTGIKALARHFGQSFAKLTYVSLQGTGCNAVEQYAADGDIITSTWLPDYGKDLEDEFGRIPWLHRNVNRRSLIPPLRFASPVPKCDAA